MRSRNTLLLTAGLLAMAACDQPQSPVSPRSQLPAMTQTTAPQPRLLPPQDRVLRPLRLKPMKQTAALVATAGTRAEFEAQGTIAFNYGFEDFPTDEGGFGYPPNP